MKKASVFHAASGTAKKAAKAAGKVARTGVKQVARVSTGIMKIEMPSSLNWIFGFGFKIGVFLILKSFLILRYQAFNLQLSGAIMILSQLIQALALIACGALMQNERLYDEPNKLRKIANYYGLVALWGVLIFILRESFDWTFFRKADGANWFYNFFDNVASGIGNVSLSLLFWDCDLWTAFCGLLYFITTTYLHVSFDYEDGLWAKVFDKLHVLREIHSTEENLEAKDRIEGGFTNE